MLVARAARERALASNASRSVLLLHCLIRANIRLVVEVYDLFGPIGIACAQIAIDSAFAFDFLAPLRFLV